MQRLTIILAGWAILGLATTARAGTWSTSNWVNDASLTLTNTKTYTHAIDFASGTTFGTQQSATINGVAFTQEIVSQGGFSRNSGSYAGTDIATGNAWSLQYANVTPLGNGCFGYSAAGAGGPTGTESTKLKTAFTSSGDANTTTFDWTLTLSGLQSNTSYIFTFYSALWDSNSRFVTLDGQDDGAGNTLRVQQGAGGTNLQAQYTYNTGNLTTFTLTAQNQGALFYAFANEVVAIPEPSTWALVGLGLLGTWLVNRHRRG